MAGISALGQVTVVVPLDAVSEDFINCKNAPYKNPLPVIRHDGGLDVGLDVGIAGRILELLIDNPKITMAKMAERLNVAKRTIEREVKQLRETGRVERVGSKRFGHWKIND